MFSAASQVGTQELRHEDHGRRRRARRPRVAPSRPRARGTTTMELAGRRRGGPRPASDASVAARRDVLDVLMPARRRARGVPRPPTLEQPLPVLMLTARTEVDGPGRGARRRRRRLRHRPFALEELFARVRALLRRTANDDTRGAPVRRRRLDPGTREAKRGDREIELTRTEFSLLELFLRNPRQY